MSRCQQLAYHNTNVAITADKDLLFAITRNDNKNLFFELKTSFFSRSACFMWFVAWLNSKPLGRTFVKLRMGMLVGKLELNPC